MKIKVSIIGSGFASLSAASYLAQAGYEVHVFEKNEQFGGRARQWKHEGFTFDMGPTWYWMPDVFERFFADFGTSVDRMYQLNRLSPAYRVFFGEDDAFEVPSSIEEICKLFETHEPGSSVFLKKFLDQARTNYQVAIEDLVYQPGVSPLELITPKTIGLLNQVFQSISSQIRKGLKDPRLISLLEFPVLFLGAKPSTTPALYSFMNWADFGLGTWHPKGGMIRVVEAMVGLAQNLGVHFHSSAETTEIIVENNRAKGLMVNGRYITSDIILSGADYHHTEQLLPKTFRQYSERYWDRKTFAPSSLLFYVGFSKKLENIEHHCLFFDSDFKVHAEAIYDRPSWPTKPLFYASFASKTDLGMAPEGMEAGTFLIPIAPGITDDPGKHEEYFDQIIDRLEKLTGHSVRDHILFKKSYGIQQFTEDYNSYKGNAYGLANTLKQTAFLRPKIQSKKIENLFFCGQLTVPGPGVPPSLISGKIASEMIQKKIPQHEITV